ncbi:MAG: hypothetical protein C5B50_18465 [Verrucomicrobia bacterium]|nr:MAG: hypothetical protein C5B50_18465 [Verrucomicrobiota bacterium]
MPIERWFREMQESARFTFQPMANGAKRKRRNAPHQTLRDFISASCSAKRLECAAFPRFRLRCALKSTVPSSLAICLICP